MAAGATTRPRALASTRDPVTRLKRLRLGDFSFQGESASAVRPCLCRRDGLNRIGAECRAARVRRSESGGKRPSLLTAAANVGTAKQTSAPRKTRVAAGGADNGLHRADDDGRLAAA
jgi:hypothetical protein